MRILLLLMSLNFLMIISYADNQISFKYLKYKNTKNLFVQSSNTLGIGYFYGIKNSKVKLNTYLNYFNGFVDRIDKKDYGPYMSGSVPFEKTFLNYKFNCIEVEQYILTNLINKKKINLNLSYGISILFVISDEITYREYNYPNPDSYISITNPDDPLWVNIININISLSYYINNSLGITAIYFLKQSLVEVGPNFSYRLPNFFNGVGLSLTYKFQRNK